MRKIIILTLSAVVCIACGNRAAQKAEGRIITVTIEPLRYFTESIAGDKFTVVSMVPEGMGPETYDPTPQQLVNLGKSEAYFRIGYIGFELTWMDKLVQNNPHLLVFDTSVGVDVIREGSHRHGDHFHPGGVEPHIWNSTVNARIIAKNILDALLQMDRENEACYIERYNSLLEVIDETDQTIRDLLKENAGRTFMVYHPALSYFAREYNLHQISIEEGGKEPSATHLKSIIERCKVEDIRVIFVQPEFDTHNAGTIARQTGARIVPVTPLSYNWGHEMVHIAKSLQHE